MDSFERQWLDYIKSICDDAYTGIKEKTLSSCSVRGVIRHLPVIGVSDYSAEGCEECYKMVSKCISKLWVYSQEQGFVKNDISLDYFIRSGMNFKYFMDYKSNLSSFEKTIPITIALDFEKFADWIKIHKDITL